MHFGNLLLFLEVYVFGFLKYVDNIDTDESIKNFYMEREWRVMGDVKFELDDVYRVFSPSSYARRFREDLPRYIGQVSFVDV